ncbi:hypothetical protein [Rhodococcus sp. Q]|uniref:hypothetical protein n=1 Tax=Rhodococcus sp. Q TaxID=2502252 RepID=UPI0010F502F2|nr:hypothetical protein [Rhodococcus sp. Q]
MAGNLARGGVAILAMLTVAASGAAAGVANAAGSAGSSDEACSLIEGGCGGETQLGYGSRGDIAIKYMGPYYAVAGQDVTFTAELGVPFGEGLSQGAVVDSVTHRAPEGFTFTGADVTSYEQAPGVYPVKFLESSAVVDSETGDVTVTAPSDGWAVPSRAAGGIVYVNIHYRVAKPITDEFIRSHITFTGPKVPASDEWVAEGATFPGVVDPAFVGSSES